MKRPEQTILSTPTSSTIDYTRYNILLVDDTPNNLDVLIDFLQAYGFGLRVARTGETAIQRVLYDAPDIILLDVLLPGMDGFETCRQLKANSVTTDIPVLFMTSLANAEDKVRGFEVGAVDYVTKPLQQAEVLARITTHLRQHNLTQNLQAQNQQLIHSNQVEKERLLEAVDQQRTQLRLLAGRLTDVQERERERLSRELHDEMGQALTAIRINLASIEKELASAASPRIRECLTEASQLTDDTLEQIRELSLDLRPPILDDLGLIPTLRWYVGRFAKRMNIQVDFQVSGFEQQPRLPRHLETALYRVLQEALTNIARHAAASQVQLHLSIGSATSQMPKTNSLEVYANITDNGCGFEPEMALSTTKSKIESNVETMNGAGLLGMRERVTLLGGTWQLYSEPNAGTQIQIRLPFGGLS
ncbi:MAG: response regulator [Chloroflexota bacterium]